MDYRRTSTPKSSSARRAQACPDDADEPNKRLSSGEHKERSREGAAAGADEAWLGGEAAHTHGLAAMPPGQGSCSADFRTATGHCLTFSCSSPHRKAVLRALTSDTGSTHLLLFIAAQQG